MPVHEPAIPHEACNSAAPPVGTDAPIDAAVGAGYGAREGATTTQRDPVAEPAGGVDVVRVVRGHDDRFEVWTRVTDDASILGVSAIRLVADAATWEIAVAAARVAPPPLERVLQQAITDSLIAIPGIVDAFHEAGEIWMVHGEASGEALIGACAKAVDGVAGGLRGAGEPTMAYTADEAPTDPEGQQQR